MLSVDFINTINSHPTTYNHNNKQKKTHANAVRFSNSSQYLPQYQNQHRLKKTTVTAYECAKALFVLAIKGFIIGITTFGIVRYGSKALNKITKKIKPASDNVSLIAAGLAITPTTWSTFKKTKAKINQRMAKIDGYGYY